jgi:hypothetical protein
VVLLVDAAEDEVEVMLALVLVLVVAGADELEAGVLEAAPVAPATVNVGRKL